MPQISINNKYITSSISNNIKFIFFGVILISYFAWMDIALFVHLQRWSPPLLNRLYNKNVSSSSGNEVELFSTFKPLSVKLIMVDHVSHYIHDIFARYIEDTLHFTALFPWITANTVSFTGLFLSLIGSRLIISERIEYMRLGAILIEIRNLGDALDGVVYRSHQRRRQLSMENGNLIAQPIVYQSNHGTSGFKVDAICDGLGGLFVIVAILVKFLKHPPSKDRTSRLIITGFNSLKTSKLKERKTSIKYEKLINSDNSKQHSVQMEQLDSQSNISDVSSSENNDAIIITTNAANAFATTSNETYYNDQMNNTRKFSARQIKYFVISFGIRVALTCTIWDHYVVSYHDLIMNFSDNPAKRRIQGQAFKSIGMWLIMWFWRIGSACAILEHLSIMAFF